MHKVARLIVSFIRVIASSPTAIKLVSSNFTFSNEISEHDWPSIVVKELIETPSELESINTSWNSPSFLQLTINLVAFPPFRTSVFVPFKLLSLLTEELGDK